MSSLQIGSPVAHPDVAAVTVLIVEDDFLIRNSIAEYLHECDFIVIEATDAAEALVVLCSGEFTIDVVFTDVNIPGSMNGFGLARWVRANRPLIEVIITSGAEKAEVAQELCGSDQFLQKPYGPAIVEQMIRRASTRQRRSRRWLS